MKLAGLLTLVFLILAAASSALEFKEFEFDSSVEPTFDNALDCLMKSRDDITEMADVGLPTTFVNDTMLSAERSFFGDKFDNIPEWVNSQESQLRRAYLRSLAAVAKETPLYEFKRVNYSQTLMLCQLIDFTKVQAFGIMDSIALTEQKAGQLNKSGADVTYGVQALNNAKDSFNDERYTEAQNYLQDADTELDRAETENTLSRQLLRLSKSFIILYWWQILVIMLILAMISPLIFRKIVVYRAKKRLERMKMEMNVLTNLLKKAQEQCFKERSITEDTYKVRTERYLSRISEIKHTIPVLEDIIAGKGRRKEKEEKGKGVLVVK